MNNKIVSIYFEGNDTKVALFQKDKGKITLLKADSIDTSLAFSEEKKAEKSNGGPKVKEILNFTADESSTFGRTFLQKMNEFFLGEDISKLKFIPILSEPALYFQKINDEKELAHLNINKKGKIETTIGYVQMYDNSRLAIYPSGKSTYLQAMDSLARMNNRRFLKMPSVKSAEISLINYILKKRTFMQEEFTLLLYIGKEYSKLIFLKGDKIFYIGSKLSVGKNSFNAHSVLVSKILLEMENSLVPRMNNIIVCGEDNSDELFSFLEEAYPDVKAEFQNIIDMEINQLDSFNAASSFIINAAVAEEYFAELEKKMAGINLLPEYVKEEQKFLSIQWPGYVVIGLILLSAIFFVEKGISNNQTIAANNKEIKRFELLQVQNREAVEKIRSYENKLQNVDNTRNVLKQLSAGTGIVSAELKRIAQFVNGKNNFWLSSFNMDPLRHVKLDGYTSSRIPVKELTDSYQASILENIIYDPLKDIRTFKFKIDAGSLTQGGGINEKK